MDLITVGLSLHWFDQGVFYKEVRSEKCESLDSRLFAFEYKGKEMVNNMNV